MNLRTNIIILLLIWMAAYHLEAQPLQSFNVSTEWEGRIRDLAPENATVEPKKPRHALIFSLHTGYEHWVIPHVDAVMRILAEKTGAYTLEFSKDIGMFEAGRLEDFDVVILNNNCSRRDRRDLFWDKLGENSNLSSEERMKMAAQLEKNLIRFVRQGKGLMLIHGGIIMQNNSMAFGEMVGGSFDYHPPQQEISLQPVDPSHPLLQAFEGESFVHIDEPYFFKNAYTDYNFRPLLSMDVTKLHSLKSEVPDKIKYVSWIKAFGKGRVFYISPSHNAQSYESRKLLRYLLDGFQYAAGDLECDDSPLEEVN